MPVFEREVLNPKFVEFYHIVRDKLRLLQKYNAVRLFLMTEMTRSIKVDKATIGHYRKEYNYGCVMLRCDLVRRWRVKDGKDFYYEEENDYRFTLRMFFGLESCYYNNSILIHNPYYREIEKGFPNDRDVHEKKKSYEIPLRKKKPTERQIQERFNLMDANMMPYSLY